MGGGTPPSQSGREATISLIICLINKLKYFLIFFHCSYCLPSRCPCPAPLAPLFLLPIL
ncbi:hypothetical protein HMPREF3187_01762 [Aerococcus christensenii]|uniref:Uncharacterized protein n=1 Tax=Aerococcus christensenii TaxID=87541 RepID=A0A133XQA2_9LACT|nr:hypothetical protein HMPREF3187_01762 [Aerococcus christensenii]